MNWALPGTSGSKPSRPTDPRPRRERRLPDSLPRRTVHLAALWAYGVSEPVLSLLDTNPEFFVARNSTRFEIVVFAVLFAFGPPVAAAAYVGFATRLSRWVGDVLFLALLGMFLAPVAFQLERPFEPTRNQALAVAGVLCAAGVAAYVRWRAVRMFLAFSLIVPIVGLALFVRGAPSRLTMRRRLRSGFVSPPDCRPGPRRVPRSSLLTESGRIDLARYPNFGKLAESATWYRTRRRCTSRPRPRCPRS